MEKMFVPKKICVGFRKINKALINKGFHYYDKYGILTYRDEKNRIKKEGTWINSCDSSIERKEFDNVIMENLYLNRTRKSPEEIRIDNAGCYYGDVLTITDERGFEWPITSRNLIYLFTHGIKVDENYKLIGKFIYAVNNYGEIVLISCDSADYKESIEHTDKLYGKYVTAKKLVPGYVYLDKNNEKYVYLGRFNKYKDKYNYSSRTIESQNLGQYFYFVHVCEYGKKEYHYLYTVKSISKKFMGYEGEKEAKENLIKYNKELVNALEFNRIDIEKSVYIDVDEQFIKEGFDYFVNTHTPLNLSLRLSVDDAPEIYKAGAENKVSNPNTSKYASSYLDFEKKAKDKYMIKKYISGIYSSVELDKYLKEHTLKFVESYHEDGRIYKGNNNSEKRKELLEIFADIVENDDLEKLKEIKSSITYNLLHVQKDFLFRYSFKLNKNKVFEYLLEEYSKMDYDLLGSVSSVHGDRMDELMDYLIENY